MKFMNAIEQLKGSDKELLRIAEDGALSADEIPQMERVLDGVRKLAAIACEIQIYLEKHR